MANNFINLNSAWYFDRKKQVGTPDLSFIYKKISLFGRVNVGMVDHIVKNSNQIIKIVIDYGLIIKTVKESKLRRLLLGCK